MAKPGSAGSSSSATWVWAVAALAVVALFLVWLGVTSEPSAVAAPQGEDPMETAGPPPATGEPIDPATLGSDAGSLIGRQVQVTLPIAAKLGTQLLWMDLPGGAPYMVKTTEETAAMLQPGSQVTVVGTVRAKDDAVVAGWRESGVLVTDGDAQQALVGATYLDAVEIRPAGM